MRLSCSAVVYTNWQSFSLCSLATSLYLSTISRQRLFFLTLVNSVSSGKALLQRSFCYDAEMFNPSSSLLFCPLCPPSLFFPFLTSTSVAASQTFSYVTCQQLLGFLSPPPPPPCKCCAYVCSCSLFPSLHVWPATCLGDLLLNKV